MHTALTASMAQNSRDASDWRSVSRTIQPIASRAAGRFMPWPPRTSGRNACSSGRGCPVFGSRVSSATAASFTTDPLTITATRSHSLLHLGQHVRDEQDRLRRRPCARRSRRAGAARPTRSSPSVGSSRTSRSGSLSSAWASPSRWTMPLLKREIGSAARSARPTQLEQFVDARPGSSPASSASGRRRSGAVRGRSGSGGSAGSRACSRRGPASRCRPPAGPGGRPAPGRPAEGEQELDQRGLAGPVGAEQAEHLAGRDAGG